MWFGYPICIMFRVANFEIFIFWGIKRNRKIQREKLRGWGIFGILLYSLFIIIKIYNDYKWI